MNLIILDTELIDGEDPFARVLLILLLHTSGGTGVRHLRNLNADLTLASLADLIEGLLDLGVKSDILVELEGIKRDVLLIEKGPETVVEVDIHQEVFVLGGARSLRVGMGIQNEIVLGLVNQRGGASLDLDVTVLTSLGGGDGLDLAWVTLYNNKDIA